MLATLTILPINVIVELLEIIVLKYSSVSCLESISWTTRKRKQTCLVLSSLSRMYLCLSSFRVIPKGHEPVFCLQIMTWEEITRLHTHTHTHYINIHIYIISMGTHKDLF